MQAEQQYLDLFSQEHDTLCAAATAVQNAHRAAAYEQFRTTGFPTRTQEQYRYIDVPPLFAPDYGVNLRRLRAAIDPYKTFRCYVPSLHSALFFVVNDSFYAPPQEQQQAVLPKGVHIASFASFAQAYPTLFAEHYNRLAAEKGDSLAAFNTMFAQDGIAIYIERGVQVEQPLQVVNMLYAAVDMLSVRRVLVVMDEGAQASILFCDHASSDVSFLTSQVVEVFVGKGATLEWTSIEETHTKSHLVNSIFIAQEEQATLTHHTITLHNGTTRNNVDIALRGEGAQCACYGCAILDKQQQADNNTYIQHIVGHCDSREMYKYVLNDASHGVFTGRVLVCQDAQKTNSQIRNQNLCATREARMQTQPMLEIYADDVKCAHGATIGQLSDAALFYMQQRGIPESEARRLLQIAFVREVIDNIQLLPLRERLQYLVERRFRGELSKCEGCALCL